MKSTEMVMSLVNDGMLIVNLPDGSYPLIYLNWVYAGDKKEMNETVIVKNGKVDTESLMAEADKYLSRNWSLDHIFIELIEVENKRICYFTGS